MKRVLVGFLAINLSGCLGLGEKKDPPGCTDIPPTTQSRGAQLIGDISVQPYASTLLALERGRFTNPIPSIYQLDEFRANLARSQRNNMALKGLSYGELVAATAVGSSNPNKNDYLKAVSEASKAMSLSGVGVTTTLMSIEMMLDDLLNRANSALSSQLFAMRSHVAATVSDLNVVLKDRMQDTYDKLNEQQRQALDRAMLLASEAQHSLDILVKEGAFAASDLLCQTTVNFANYPNTIVSLGLPFERCFSPDILCLSSAEVRDTGTPQAEQMLQFRGVNLLPNGEYADAVLLVSGNEIKLPTAGGKSVLQLPLPGGINGEVGDMSPRGALMARLNFSWPKNNVERRWFFELKPFQVRSIQVVYGFEIEGPIRSIREQQCHVSAEGGALGSREEYAICTIVPDTTDKSIERCEEGAIVSQNGDAGIRNRLPTAGACTWELRAKSKGFYGAGAWFDFIGRAHQMSKQRVASPAFTANKLLNQNEKTWIIDYPEELVPAEYRIIQGTHRYSVVITNNEGNCITLTEARPSDPKFGSAIVVGKRLTITLN